MVYDPDQYSTDLMKCIHALEERDAAAGTQVRARSPLVAYLHLQPGQSDIIVLGGLSGRLDQTVHTLSLLHKLRKGRRRIYAVTDDNLAWVLDEVSFPSCTLHVY